jgi:3-hydroxybutyrate dehydrogenase
MPDPRVALVTGGGRGIGREIALAMARAGLTVAVAARTAAQVEETAAAARALGATAQAFILDVTDPAAVAAVVGELTARLGPVDVLVNDAGIAEATPFPRTELGHWERHLRVNATGPYLLTREVLPGMLERGWGRVINVASMAGLIGAPYVSAYTASKHALVGLTRAVAAEVAGTGVTVNAICPGYVATDMVWSGARNIAARTGRTFADAVEAMARMNPGRRLIEPAEVAEVAVRLLGDEATNGETIILDGTARGGARPAGTEGSMSRHIESVNPATLSTPTGFSHGVVTRGGRLLVLAGQVARDRDGNVVGKGDLVAQFRQVCDNIRTVVTAAGGQMTDVIKLTIYVLDTDDYKARLKPIGAVYREYFGRHFPAMTLIGVRDLFDASAGCLIEIEGMAALP